MTISLEDVNTALIMSQSVELIAPLARKYKVNILLDESGLDDLPPVRADYTRLKQVLVNLITNAIKYNKIDGRVMLDCASVGTEYVRFTITDTGRGIANDRFPDLFKPFDRLDAEQSGIEGTGIGLTITKKLVELMEGEIGLESTLEVGSTFWVDIPQAKGRSEAKLPNLVTAGGKTDSRNPEAASNRKLILYVEDNPDNLELMSQILGDFTNVELVTAHNGELGLELAEAHKPDLILLDINLPGIDGFKVLERLKNGKETKAIPVIAVSAAAMPKDIAHGLEAGFKDYVTKPINIGKTVAAISNQLNQA